MGILGGTARAAHWAGAFVLIASLGGCPSEGSVGPLCGSYYTACETNADCCGWSTRNAYCVEDVCVPTCDGSSDCPDGLGGCCADTTAADVRVCWVESACGGLVPEGGPCTRVGDCAGSADDVTCVLNGTLGAFGQCVRECTQNRDCATGCCAPTTGGSLVCSPARFCDGLCVDTGGPCSGADECCGVGDPLFPARCVNTGVFTGQGQCVPECQTDGDCGSGCCVTLTEGGTACVPARFCEDPRCDDTCDFPNDGECDDGGAGMLTQLCDFGTDCGDCGPR